MFHDDEFLIPDFMAGFRVRLVRNAGGAQQRLEQRSEAERRMTRSALLALRFGVETDDRRIVRVAERMYSALGHDLDFHQQRLAWFDIGHDARRQEMLRQLLLAFEAGWLVVVGVKEVEALGQHKKLPEFPDLKPPKRVVREKPNATAFEAWFLDEVGQPISGLEVEFNLDGQTERLKTNAAGIALLDDITTTTFACSVNIPNLEALEKIVVPRWAKHRSGPRPTGKNLVERVLTGSELGSFSLRPVIPNTIVIKPPLGTIALELYDRAGRVRHAQSNYKITGPQTFKGTTDDEGRILHENVLPGDYELELTLEFFEGRDKVVDTYKSPLVVRESVESAVRMLGVVPRVVLAQLHMFFNTNRTFLLPTALPAVRKLRQIYAANSPGKLLVVGHADTPGTPEYNDQLSLERAEATIAYLKDDHEAWLKFYNSDDKKKRWGRAEDHLMLTAMLDFVGKPKGEEPVRWYQRTRGLKVDGVAGEKTRTQLIKEYMALDGASLEEEGLAIEAIAHGCGEHFPLDDTGEELDAAPENNKRDRLDRRCELFFFDDEFGIIPAPPGQNSKAGSTEYLKWRERADEVIDLEAGDPNGPQVTFIELIDALFRTNSAVVLPEGETPSKDSDKLESLTSVGAFATALRFNDEHPGKKILIAGHTDTTDTVDFNQKLSEERAACVLALLTGDREAFKTICAARHKNADYKQILAWVTRAFPDLQFDCDPGKIDDSPVFEPVRKFQKAYNRNKSALGASGPDLNVDGAVGPLTWGAFFDCYEFALRQELGEDENELTELRKKLTFVDDNKRSLGFSEHFPIDELGVDNFRSQANRRAEILFFDAGEEPDVEHAAEDPETSELYLPGTFMRAPVKPMVSARRWTARWDAETANANDTRVMVVNAPGLPPGVPIKFEVRVVDVGALESGTAISDADSIAIPFDDWEAPSAAPFAGELEAGQDFLPVFFDFIIEGGGRRVESQTRLRYADSVNLVLQLDDEGEASVLANEPYVLCTPWGHRKGVTDEQGVLLETGLGPGSGLIALRRRHLIHPLVLDHNWDAEPA